MVTVSRGEWQAAITLADESLFAGITTVAQIQQLSILAMIEHMTGTAPTLEAQISLVLPELRAWQSSDALLQLAPWILLRKRDSELERNLDAAVLALNGQPPSPIALAFVPLSLALLAQKIGKTAWLKLLIDSERFKDRCAWASMQWQLARGVALQTCKDTRANDILNDAAARARTLGAGFFAAYAAFRCGAATDSDSALLKRLRLSELGHGTSRSSHGLTVRELQVARLVGDGKSNREIAEELVLSERTIERHLGNVFDKLQLESRAKLMRWLFENDSGSNAL